MKNLNKSAVVDLMSDMILANEARERLLRIARDALHYYDQGTWVATGWLQVMAGNYEDAYDTWHNNYDALERMLGAFVKVNHMPHRTDIARQQAQRLSGILKQWIESGETHTGAEMFALLTESYKGR